MPDVTTLLAEIERGEPQAAELLWTRVYRELRHLAAAKLAREKPGQTLDATALVHEAYLHLVQGDRPLPCDSRAHFFAAAAEAMRRILVDRARRKRTHKRGGQYVRADLDLALLPAPLSDDKLLALDDALRRLEGIDSRKAELVKLRFFVGLTIQDAAQLLSISTATADRDWAYARAWLQEEMMRHSA